jgi:zinc D-Ala-D-Ala dipeptidase
MVIRFPVVMILVVLSAGFALAQESAPAKVDLSKVPGLVDAAGQVPSLAVELKYSTKDNFLGKDVYGDLEACYLQKDAVEMLAKAAKTLEELRPDLELLAYDCVRPVSVQRVMWTVVEGTPQQGYVANPNSKTGSIHNYGCAIDLTLATKHGKPLDMGTKFDFFGKKAQPRHELDFFRKKELSADQYANRLLLRLVMVKAGFLPIPNEWWHFNCASPAMTRKRYKKVP